MLSSWFSHLQSGPRRTLEPMGGISLVSVLLSNPPVAPPCARSSLSLFIIARVSSWMHIFKIISLFKFYKHFHWLLEYKGCNIYYFFPAYTSKIVPIYLTTSASVKSPAPSVAWIFSFNSSSDNSGPLRAPSWMTLATTVCKNKNYISIITKNEK